MRTRKWRRALAVLAAPLIGLTTLSLTPAVPASAATAATESGDAPALMPGQAIGAVDTIQGTLGVAGDIDMYDFCTAGSFSAEVTEFPANVGGARDSELFLFYANGAFIEANDDIDYWGGNRLSRINHTMPTTKAHYLLAVGSFNITANHSPITSWDSSGTATGAYTIALTGVLPCTDTPGKGGTSTTINSVDPASPRYGQSLSFDTTVVPVAPAVGTPTGAVTYEVNKFAGTPDATGYVAFDPATDVLPVGTHHVQAVYPGDDNFEGSTSGAFVVTVVKAATATTINSVDPASPTYGQALSFDTTVAPVAPGDGTPSGDVTYKVNKFAGTPDATGYVDFVPGTDLLPAGTHHVQAYYAGDGNFNGSESNAFVVEVAQASSTVTYLGDYLATTGNAFTLKAQVDSSAAGCKADRDVTFTLTDGVHAPIVLTANSGTGGVVTKLISSVGWPTGLYDVLVEVAETNNCTAASNALAEDVITVATPGDAATGGGWYFYKDAGAGKRVNFGFTVSKQTDNSYKGSLLLMNQGVWRLKGSLDSFARTDALTGQAGGTGTLYQWVLANPSDPMSGSWVNPQVVSFKIAFTDEAAGKAKGKKSVVVDQFALTQIGFKSTNPPLPISPLMGLKGGNIVLR